MGNIFRIFSTLMVHHNRLGHASLDPMYVHVYKTNFPVIFANVISKIGVQFLDHDLESVLYPFTLEDKAIWVPQAPIQSSHIPLGLTQTSALDVAAQGC